MVKDGQQNFSEPKPTSSYRFECPVNSAEPKDIQILTIEKRETTLCLTFLLDK